MYRKILQEPLTFPGPEIVPPAARDLLTRLLDRDPQRRLGSNGAAEIKAHHFFSNIDWRKLLQRKYEPTFKPNVVRTDFFLLIEKNGANMIYSRMHGTRRNSTRSSREKLLKTRT